MGNGPTKIVLTVFSNIIRNRQSYVRGSSALKSLCERLQEANCREVDERQRVWSLEFIQGDNLGQQLDHLDLDSDILLIHLANFQ